MNNANKANTEEGKQEESSGKLVHEQFIQLSTIYVYDVTMVW